MIFTFIFVNITIISLNIISNFVNIFIPTTQNFMLVSFNIILSSVNRFILVSLNIIFISLYITNDLTNILSLVLPIYQQTIILRSIQISSILCTDLAQQIFNTYINSYI